jgi:antitoxin component of MazEF toxin-antitoxin module
MHMKVVNIGGTSYIRLPRELAELLDDEELELQIISAKPKEIRVLIRTRKKEAEATPP